MPLELGVFLGAKRFGFGSQKAKRCVVFDKTRYRFQKYISDLSGQDIHAHRGTEKRLIEELATWLRAQSGDQKVPGGRRIAAEFTSFKRRIPGICNNQGIHPDELTFGDYATMVAQYLASTAT
jgi:hypothetical protein